MLHISLYLQKIQTYCIEMSFIVGGISIYTNKYCQMGIYINDLGMMKYCVSQDKAIVYFYFRLKHDHIISHRVKFGCYLVI